MGDNRCVCCGKIIPEGIQVCKICWDYDSEDKIPEIGTLERLLFDYGFDDEEGLRYAIDQYQKLITELTYGILSKLTYSADTIMEVIRQHEEDSNEAHYDVDPDHPQAPTVEAEPVRYGQWIHIRTAGVISVWKCSECDNTITANFAITNPANHDKFCYNCGAKMYGGEQRVDN